MPISCPQVDEQQHLQRQSRSTHESLEKLPQQRFQRGPEEREGETSGYASDNLEGPGQRLQQQIFTLPCHGKDTPDLFEREMQADTEPRPLLNFITKLLSDVAPTGTT
jgi:hypothetical protein